MVLIEHIAMSKCRLCHAKPGLHDINMDKKFAREIYECIKIRVNDKAMGLLPPCVCEECKKTIKDFFLYKQHIKKIDQCLRNILLNKKSESSDLRNSSLEIVKCSECSATFKNHSIFKQHLKSHSSKSTDRLCTHLRDERLCLTCNDNFKNLLKYESHQCHKNECSEDTFIKEEIQQEKSPVFENEETARISQNNSDAKKVTITQLNCKICEQKFSTKQELRIHKKAHKRKYVCTWKDCEKILNSAYTLKTHELKHQGKRSFLCVTCGKGFITKNSLTCHEKIHLEVKGYTCKLCNIGFSVRSNLRAHEKKHHEGIRFYCSQCTKAFVSKCSLERHERIHTGIKEFQCESCPSAFYTNKELVKHQRYHQCTMSTSIADENENTERLDSEAGKNEKMFTLKKWNAVAMWSWDVECDTCAICRVQVMDACLRCQAESKKDSYGKQDCVVVWGECNHSFHYCCMSLWVKQNNRCPLCQQEWSIQRMGK